jgi:hypothetical protein
MKISGDAISNCAARQAGTETLLHGETWPGPARSQPAYLLLARRGFGLVLPLSPLRLSATAARMRSFNAA